MINASRDYIEMTFRSIECFAEYGKIDAEELGKIFEIAQRDNFIDENEVRVLKSIMSRIKPTEIDDAMQEKLSEIIDKLPS